VSSKDRALSRNKRRRATAEVATNGQASGQAFSVPADVLKDVMTRKIHEQGMRIAELELIRDVLVGQLTQANPEAQGTDRTATSPPDA
jgi:hypothetical protein